MPKFRKYKRKRSYKRKRFTRFKKKRRRVVSGNKNMVKFHDPRRAPSTIPLTMFTKMYYASTAGVTSALTFANEPYTPAFLNQPDDGLSGVSDRYRWINEMNVFYEKNVVFGFKYDIEIFNKGDAGLAVCLNWTAEDTAPSNFADATYRIGSKTQIVGREVAGNSTHRFRGWISTRTFYGGINPLTEQEFWGTNGSAPSRRIKFFISTLNVDAIADIEYVRTIRLTAYVKFFQRDQFVNPQPALDVLNARKGLDEMSLGDKIACEIDEEKESGPGVGGCTRTKMW